MQCSECGHDEEAHAVDVANWSIECPEPDCDCRNNELLQRYIAEYPEGEG